MYEPRGLMAGEMVVVTDIQLLSGTIWQVLPYTVGLFLTPRYQRFDEYLSHGVLRLVKCDPIVCGSLMVVRGDKNQEPSSTIEDAKTFHLTSRFTILGWHHKGRVARYLPRGSLRPFA